MLMFLLFLLMNQVDQVQSSSMIRKVTVIKKKLPAEGSGEIQALPQQDGINDDYDDV